MEVGAPAYFKLPEPLLTIDSSQESVVYVMRRSQGEQLGRVALDRSTSSNARTAYTRAVAFLAYFHSWRGKPQAVGLNDYICRDRMIRQSLRFWQVAKFRNYNQLQRALASIIPRETPILRKKDAHPENWLVNDDDNIVMLDLEASGSSPFLFELVQLLDDYPLLEADPEGWRERLAICEQYVDQLDRLGLDLGLGPAASKRPTLPLPC